MRDIRKNMIKRSRDKTVAWNPARKALNPLTLQPRHRCNALQYEEMKRRIPAVDGGTKH